MFDGVRCYAPMGASGLGLILSGVLAGLSDGWPYVIVGCWVCYYGLVVVNAFEQRDIDDGY